MSRYRMPDQFYEDQYDRDTIHKLKELERREAEETAALSPGLNEAKRKIELAMRYDSFKNTGIRRARDREQYIAERKQEHERWDRLEQTARIPSARACPKCSALLVFKEHLIEVVDGLPILFAFHCAHDNTRMLLRPDGTEYVHPKRRCYSCGGEIKGATERNGNIRIMTDVCLSCGRTDVDQFEIPEKAMQPITEEDRKKYCMDFSGQRTFMDDWEALAEFGNHFKEKEEQEKINEYYSVQNIEKLTIPQLENLLSSELEKEEFVKLQFERPEMKVQVVVPFAIQDSTKRSDKESIKLLSRQIKSLVFNTNWRLMGELYYRMGYITGKFKGVESEEDLLKLAKEIFESKNKHAR